MKPDPEHFLASYGTLAPGEENHHQLEGLRGHWFKGTVRGRRLKSDDDIWKDYPAFRLDPKADAVEVHIFESTDLPAHWSRLDAFEGEHYKRVVTTADTEQGMIDVSIYEFRGIRT